MPTPNACGDVDSLIAHSAVLAEALVDAPALAAAAAGERELELP